MKSIPPFTIVQDMPPLGGYKKVPFLNRPGLKKGFNSIQILVGYFGIVAAGTYLLCKAIDDDNNTIVQRTKELTARSDVLRLLYNANGVKTMADSRTHLVPFWSGILDTNRFAFVDEVQRLEKKAVVDKYREFELRAQFEGYRICESSKDEKCIQLSELSALKELIN